MTFDEHASKNNLELLFHEKNYGVMSAAKRGWNDREEIAEKREAELLAIIDSLVSRAE